MNRSNKITLLSFGLAMVIGFVIILGLQMVSAETETYKVGIANNLQFSCTLNNAIPSASTTYNISLYNPNGTALLSNQPTTPQGSGSFNYSYTFAEVGTHKVKMFCTDGIYSYSGEGTYEVNGQGEEGTTAKAIFYIGLLFVLLFFFGVCVYSFSSFDNLLSRVGMLGLGYLLLMAITFIGWNMASDFLNSSPFLVEMLRILFFVLVVGAFPMLLGAFVWYFLMVFKIKEIQRLMDKGFSEEDAQRRTSKKKR